MTQKQARKCYGAVVILGGANDDALEIKVRKTGKVYWLVERPCAAFFAWMARIDAALPSF